MNNKLTVGEILKPQGIRGELKVKPLIDDPYDFKNFSKVYIGESLHKVLSARLDGGEVYLYLSGVADRTAAEGYRGSMILIDRADAPPLGEGRYYIVDVLGCEVFTDDGEALGVVTDITSHGGDVYTVTGGEYAIMFPLLKDLLIEMDIKGKRMTVKKEKLSQISVKNKLNKPKTV